MEYTEIEQTIRDAAEERAKHNLDEAVSILQKIQLPNDDSDEGKKINALLNHELARCYFELDDLENSGKHFRKAYEIRKDYQKSNDDKRAYADTLHYFALLLQKLKKDGEDETIEQLYSEALKIRKELARKHSEANLLVAQTLNNLASLKKKDPKEDEKAHGLYQESMRLKYSLPLSLDAESNAGKSNSLRNEGYMYLREGNYSQARECASQAREFAKSAVSSSGEKYSPILAKALSLYSKVCMSQGYPEDAVVLLDEAIQIYDKLSKDKQQFKVARCKMIGAASIHARKCNLFDVAIRYAEKQLARVGMEDTHQRSKILNRIANCLLYKKELKAALDRIEECLAISNEPRYLDTKGDILLAMGKLEEAQEIKESISYYYKNHNTIFSKTLAYVEGKVAEYKNDHKCEPMDNDICDWVDKSGRFDINDSLTVTVNKKYELQLKKTKPEEVIPIKLKPQELAIYIYLLMNGELYIKGSKKEAQLGLLKEIYSNVYKKRKFITTHEDADFKESIENLFKSDEKGKSPIVRRVSNTNSALEKIITDPELLEKIKIYHSRNGYYFLKLKKDQVNIEPILNKELEKLIKELEELIKELKKLSYT